MGSNKDISNSILDIKVLIVHILIFALTLFFLSVSTQTNPVLVLFGLIPLLLYLFFFFITFKRDKMLNGGVLWITPLVFAFFFYMVGETVFPFLLDMDIEVLSILNVLVAYIMNFIFILTYHAPRLLKESNKPSKKPKSNSLTEHKLTDFKDTDKLSYYTTALENLQKELESYEEKHLLNEQDIKKYREILTHYNKKFEDYNNVITDLRTKLFEYEKEEKNKVSSDDLEYYKKIANYFHLKNEDYDKHFAKLKEELSKYKHDLKINKDNFITKIRAIEDKCKAINFVIGRVYSVKRGGNAKIREIIRIDKDLYNAFSAITDNFQPKDASKVFKILTKIMEKLSLFEMTEEEVFSSGQILSKHNEKIIDILARNDKDPVMTYYDGAKQVCIDLMNYLSQNYKF